MSGLSDTVSPARRRGMNKSPTDARTVDADLQRFIATESAAKRVRQLLGAWAVYPGMLRRPQATVECSERADGVGYEAVLVVIPTGEAPRFDTFWGFSWIDALGSLLQYVDDVREGCTPAQALDIVSLCGSETPPWAEKKGTGR